MVGLGEMGIDGVREMPVNLPPPFSRLLFWRGPDHHRSSPGWKVQWHIAAQWNDGMF